MKHFLLLALGLCLLSACNRKANKAITETKEPVMRTKPRAPEPEEVAEMSMATPPPETGNERIRSARGAVRGPQSQAARNAQRDATGKVIPTVMAEISKTACYGDCPVYTLQIMSDYTLRFEGKQHVDLIGKFEAKLNFNPMARLSPLIATSNFYRMDEQFPKDAAEVPADAASTITKIDFGGQSNTVRHYFSGPEGLLEIENYLVSLLEEVIWTPIAEEK